MLWFLDFRLKILHRWISRSQIIGCLVQSITPPTLQFLVQINCFVILGHPLNYFHPSIIASRPSVTLLRSNPQSRTQIAIRLAPLGAIQAYFLSVHTWPKPLIVSNRHIYIPAFSSPHRWWQWSRTGRRAGKRISGLRRLSPATSSWRSSPTSGSSSTLVVRGERRRPPRDGVHSFRSGFWHYRKMSLDMILFNLGDNRDCIHNYGIWKWIWMKIYRDYLLVRSLSTSDSHGQ